MEPWNSWRPGWIRSMTGDYRVAVDQWWAIGPPYLLDLRVVATMPSGEVVLRPVDVPAADRLFPLHEVAFKGKTTLARTCPFVWVDEEASRAAKDEIRKLGEQRKTAKDALKVQAIDTRLTELFPYEPGDLLAHEAWDVWSTLKVMVGPEIHRRARLDCIQDGCENAPFACVGGPTKRSAMVTPKWIAPGDAEEYLRAYRATALEQYGEGWETCEFSWAPALVINEPQA